MGMRIRWVHWVVLIDLANPREEEFGGDDDSANDGFFSQAVMNEKFGDGIMSAISFSTKVEKEVAEDGTYAVITLRGKW